MRRIKADSRNFSQKGERPLKKRPWGEAIAAEGGKTLLWIKERSPPGDSLAEASRKDMDWFLL